MPFIENIKKDPKYFFESIVSVMTNNHMLDWMSDRSYLQLKYWSVFHKALDLNSPQTFNEKIQWLKLFNRDPHYTMLVDKFGVRNYISSTIGDKYLIPLLGGPWQNVEQIDFSILPNRFVLKCTHDSKSAIICKDKNQLDINEAKKKLDKALKYNFYNYGREWPYKNVPRQIIAEQYMEDEDGSSELTDYKIHCFNGVPKVIQVITDRFNPNGMINDHYDLEWNKLDLVRGHYATTSRPFLKPKELSEMLALAKTLAMNTIYVRTDFYIVNHQIYFGELTFFPASGFNPFTPEKWDTIFGKWIRLPIDELPQSR